MKHLTYIFFSLFFIAFHSPALLAQEYSTDSVTALLMHMNEPGGVTIADVSGNNNTGSASGTTIVDAKFGKGRDFNGTGDFISVNDDNSLDLTNQFTFEAWIKLSNGLSTYPRVIFGKGRIASTTGYKFFITTDGKVAVGLNDGTINFSYASNNFVYPNEWTHVAAVYNGSILKFYINGFLDGFTSVTANLVNSGLPLFLGKELATDTNGFFEGTMDEVRISNAARLVKDFNLIDVGATIPANSMLNVPKNSNTIVQFSKPVNSVTITSSSFQVYGRQSGKHNGSLSFSNGNTQVTFTPSINFIAGEVVTVTLSKTIRSVTNDTLTNGYQYSFTISSTGSTGAFNGHSEYSAGTNPNAIFMSDIDGDGDVDVAVANYWGGDVSVSKNNGDGTFAANNNYTVGGSPWGIVICDIDNDGYGDLIVSNNNGSYVSVLKNNGNGTFAAKTDYTVSFPHGLSAGDLNGDGYADIAVTNGDYVKVFINNGDGTFASGVQYNTGGTPISIFITDVNGDGSADLITANFTTNNVSVLKNNGNGTFEPHVDYATATQPFSVYLSDIDWDNDADIAVSYVGTNSVSVLKNNGNGLFGTRTDYTTGADPKSVFIGDIDGDGDGDIVTGNYSDNTVSVLKNFGNGTFAGKIDYATGLLPNSIGMSDVDGNGHQDIITANWNDYSFSVLRNLDFTKVIGITPSQNGLGILPTTGIQVMFNAAMVTSSYNDASSFLVSGSVSGKHTGSFSFSNGNTTVTFTPTTPFTQGEIVTVDATKNITDVLSTPLTHFGSTFTISSPPAMGVFTAPTTYPTGSAPEFPVIYDVDNDGDGDLLTANYINGGSVSVLYNNNGSFTSRTDYGVGNCRPYFVAASDVDGDGYGDMIVSGDNSDSVYILKNNGNGTFAAPIGFYAGSYPWGGQVIEDIDGDGDNDIVEGINLSSIAVLINNGDGTFQPPVTYLIASDPYFITGSDMNGDGFTDILAVCPSSSRLSVLLGKGDGTFEDRVDYLTSATNPFYVAAKDLDGDGDNDVAVTNYNVASISLFFNNGDGTLNVNRIDYNAADSPTSLSLGDIDGDSDVDIIVGGDIGGGAKSVITPRMKKFGFARRIDNSKTGTNSIGVLKNSGNGVFSAPVQLYDGGLGVWGVTVGDLDGDGDGDIVAANVNNNTVSILKNMNAKVTSITPLKNGLNVLPSTNISAIFNTAVNTASFNDTASFIVSGSMSGRHKGSFSFSAGNTLSIFNPTNDFTPGEVVTVAITGKIQDATNTSVASFGSQFTVANKPSTGTFAAKTDYVTGQLPQSVFIADLDNDGDGDIMSVNSTDSTVSILKNNGNGTFALKVDYKTDYFPYYIYVSDVDGDGYADLAITNYGNSSVSILINNGNGTFQTKVDYPVGTSPLGIFIGDLDGDGMGDIVVANANSNTISVLKNNGDGTFATKVDYPTEMYPWSVYIADVDGDGDNDNVVTNWNGASVSVFKNNGDGTFAPKVDYGVNAAPGSVAVSDIDGDGDVDLVVANFFGAGPVSVLKNNGDGTFATQVEYQIGGNPYRLFVSDIDGDSDGDITVIRTAGGSGTSVSVMKNNGDGTFVAPVDYTVGGNPQDVFVGDLDGNGTADIVTANGNTNTISVFQNVSSKVTGITPAQNAPYVLPISTVQVTFNTPMQTSSFTSTSVRVQGSITGTHTGEFSFSNGNMTGTFVPNVNFKNGEEVTVIITDNVKDYTNAPVTPFVSQFTIANTASTGTFGGKKNYATGTFPSFVYFADIDQDYDADMIVTNSNSNSVSILKNNGDGTFAAKVDYATGLNPVCVSISDIDGDGDEDIAVADWSDGAISVLKNDGNGIFATKVDYVTGNNPFSVVIGDVDVDGKGDLIVASQNSNAVSVLRNNGDGTFAPKVDYAVGNSPITLDFGDLDGDGDGDIAVANFSDGNVSILKNNGDGTFAPKVDYVTGGSSYSVYMSDVDGDGDADLAVTNDVTNLVSILKNNGDGTFASAVNYPTGTDPRNVIITDIDGDGDGDMLIANSGSNNISAFINNGDGTFMAKADYPAGNYTQWVFAADIDGDADADIAVVNSTDNIVSVIKNLTIGSISGQVYEDLNGNGVKEGTETGLAGWKITLNGTVAKHKTPVLNHTKPGVAANDKEVKRKKAADKPIVNDVHGIEAGSGSVIDSAFTDANGNYTFTNILAGTYSIGEEVQTGYVQTYPANGGVRSISLNDGQLLTGIDFGNRKPGIIVITPPPDSTILWNDSTIWSGNHIPTASDTVTIPPNVTILLNIDSLPAGRDSIGTLIISDSSTIRTTGSGTFHVLGTFNVMGNFLIDSAATPTLNCKGNFIVSGTFSPGNSTVDLTGDSMQIVGDSISPIVPPKQKSEGGNSIFAAAVPRTSFNNLIIDNEFAITAGTLVINNTLNLNRDLTIGTQPGNIPDTLLIQNGAPTAVTGTGIIHNGTMKRRIFTGQPGKTASKFQFHDPYTAIELDSVGVNPLSITMTKVPSITSFGSQYATFKGGTVDSVHKFVKVSNISNFSRWTFGQVGYKDNTGGPTYDISADTVAITKAGVNSFSSFTAGSVSLSYDPALLNGNPQSALGFWKTATAIRVNVVADDDGSNITTNDRSAKQWSVKIYKSSVSPANLITSGNNSLLLADDIGTGTFIVQLADTTHWQMIQHTVNTTSTNDTAHSVTVSLTEGKIDSIVFSIYRIDLTKFRTFSSSYQGYTEKATKLSAKKKKKPDVGTYIVGSGPTLSLRTAEEYVFSKLGKSGVITFGVNLTGDNAAKTHGWLSLKGSKALGAFLVPAQTGISLPIDSVTHNNAISSKGKRSGKAYTKGISLTSTKTAPGNRLWAEGALLKFNIAASQNDVTPSGFGTLTLDTALTLYGRNLNGATLIDFATYLDSLMTFWKEHNVYDTTGFGAHTRTWTDAYTATHTTLDSLATMIKKINDGFYSPLDTTGNATTKQNDYIDSAAVAAKKAYAVVLAGVKNVNDAVSFLKNPNVHRTQVMDFSNGGRNDIPDNFGLNQNYPNPFNPVTTIGFQIPDFGLVSLKVYDVLGREVATLVNNETMDAGEYEISFDASHLSSGVYFYRLTAKSENGKVFTQAKKLVLMK